MLLLGVALLLVARPLEARESDKRSLHEDFNAYELQTPASSLIAGKLRPAKKTIQRSKSK